jgi:hypothetical protein
VGERERERREGEEGERVVFLTGGSGAKSHMSPCSSSKAHFIKALLRMYLRLILSTPVGKEPRELLKLEGHGGEERAN